MKSKKKLLMGAAILGLMASCSHSEVMCYGVNSCKGHGECAGMNSCKGKGLKKMSKKDCIDMDGQVASIPF